MLNGGPLPSLRPYVVVATVVAVMSLAGFAVVSVLDVGLLVDPSPALDRPDAAAALAGVGLLVADVVLPVPSSVVMVAHGALFGVVAGAVLSLTGRVGAAVAGAAIGRGGRRWTAGHGGAPARGEDLVRRWGPVAVVVSRPIPVLAESVAVAAGAAAMPWPTLVVAAALGALPESVLYAAVGAVAASFNSAGLVFALLVGAAVLAWVVWARRPADRQ